MTVLHATYHRRPYYITCNAFSHHDLNELNPQDIRATKAIL
jgi:hypothetical protein